MLLIKRFPYKIISFLENTTINVLAVFHEKRDPALIEKRIKPAS